MDTLVSERWMRHKGEIHEEYPVLYILWYAKRNLSDSSDAKTKPVALYLEHAYLVWFGSARIGLLKLAT